jgi:hypothetical protein
MPLLRAYLLGDRLIPADGASLARWERLPRGTPHPLEVTINNPRTNPIHRGFWGAMISNTSEALRDGPSGLSEADDEWVLTMFASAAGMAAARPQTEFEQKIYGGGPTVAARFSTRFANMDQTTFMRLVGGARDVLALSGFAWLEDHPRGREARAFARKLGAEI